MCPVPKHTLEEFPLGSQLILKDRALAASVEGITIADAKLPSQPLIYVNAGFERLTGYSAASVLGRNCRFLQGPGTDPSIAMEIRQAIKAQRECTVEILNYRKDGVPFWNRLSLTPIFDESGHATHFIGIQSDITARVQAEQNLREAKQQLEEAYRKTKKDLEMAARIQQTLLPPDDFQMRGVELDWISRPCDELAGDAFNVLNLDGEHLGFYLIDVCGHGVGSALLSVTLSRMLTSLPEQSCLFGRTGKNSKKRKLTSPGHVAEQLNRQFPMDPQAAQYFTLFYGILNTRSGLLRYVNAGHPPPILIAKGQNPGTIPGGGFPVGMFANPGYREESLQMSAGCRLYLFTDGIVDALDPLGDEYGTPRLTEIIRATASQSLAKSLEIISLSMEEWSRHTPPHDDITLLALEFLARQSW
jgi:sigma-B regulation protein RsbU (phosphoserine phosphatase)